MTISENSRVWIYQAQRQLTKDEEDRIQGMLNNFTSEWQAHGHDLAALGEIRHHQFIILSVDENIAGATGCSIDKLVYLMKDIEKEFGLDLFDRFRIAFRDMGSIINCNREEFEAQIKSGLVNGQTIVFNNLISRRKELQSSWEIPLKDSWHATVFAI